MKEAARVHFLFDACLSALLLVMHIFRKIQDPSYTFSDTNPMFSRLTTRGVVCRFVIRYHFSLPVCQVPTKTRIWLAVKWK